MTILHRPGKTHSNANALLRVFTTNDLEPNQPPTQQLVTETTRGDIQVLTIHSSLSETSDTNRGYDSEESDIYTTIIHLDKALTKDVAAELPTDKTFSKVYRDIVKRYTDSPKNKKIATF